MVSRFNDCLRVRKYLYTPCEWLGLTDLLITYARFPIKSLAEDTISFVDRPHVDKDVEKPLLVLVSSGKSVFWSFKLEECQTWSVSAHILYRCIPSMLISAN